MGNKHTTQRTKALSRTKPGKVASPFDKKLENVEWREFKLADLFDVSSSKNIYHASDIDRIFDEQIDNSLPYVVRTTQNNGIRGYVVENEIYANDGNTLSFAQDTFSVFYQKKKYFTGNKVKVLKAKFEKKSEKVMQYLTACFQKSLNSFSWGIGSTVETIALTKIQLPTKNGNIDFEFMESFIAELEAERMAKLEAYLVANNLKDYTLTAEEEKVLKDFENVEWEEFNVIDVFNVKNTKNIMSRDIIENSGSVPYLCASAENNAVSSYISYNEEYLDKGNCVFIGGKTFVVSFQENDFYSNDSHNLVLYLKNEREKSKQTQIFLASCINKSLGHKYSWGDSISNRKIQTDKVSLPISIPPSGVRGLPDYALMQTFISAIQKLVVKDVVLYVDKKNVNLKNKC
ncbi:MAG: restriction endonuclease subunit S [Bacteroidetes bacterium]|nr:MAG: restriction endonuclease subunit S [Bacteroidota bacterium]